MDSYTLDTDFFALNSQQARNWMIKFGDIMEDAFANCDDRHRLLGNLLIMEPYIHTVSQGLAISSKQLSHILQHTLDLLWDYLEGHTVPADFQDFANNLYACVIAHNVGTADDAPEEFYKEYFAGITINTYEWLAIEWNCILMMQLLAITRARLDFDEFEGCERVDFYGVSEMLNLLEDACIGLTNTPCIFSTERDREKALDQVHQTPLFQQIISHFEVSLKTAITAVSEQFPFLRDKYRQYTIIPEKYAKDLLEY